MGPWLYSECKIFLKMPLKRNRVLESDSEKEEPETNSGLIIVSNLCTSNP
jgi:hypothetical protein